MNSNKKKLLIVDDSAFMRKLIGDFFKDNPVVEVVGIARNGKDAIQKIKHLKPDVVTMDVEMPEMDGIEALREIMAVSPVPVVMLSSTTSRGAENTLKAMEYGAIDFVAKPSGTISLDLEKIKEELVEKVIHAANIPIRKVKKSVSLSKKIEKPIEQVPTKSIRWNQKSRKVVLIGTSTGGPRALQVVLCSLPKTIKAPILIVQHMPAGFTKSLATRLNQLADIEIKEAEHGDILQDGHAYIAPGGYHMKLRKTGPTLSIELDNQEPPRAGHRPSVDVLFENVSKHQDFDKVAVIMTGMGSDGSKGLIQLKQHGQVVSIAESSNTAIIYGMPKAAVETQLVNEIVDLEKIANSIIQYLP